MEALIGPHTREVVNFVTFRFMTEHPEESVLLAQIDGFVEYDNPVEDAIRRDCPTIVLAVQKELVDEKRTLLQTSAGQKIQEQKRKGDEIKMGAESIMQSRINSVDTTTEDTEEVWKVIREQKEKWQKWA